MYMTVTLAIRKSLQEYRDTINVPARKLTLVFYALSGKHSINALGIRKKLAEEPSTFLSPLKAIAVSGDSSVQIDSSGKTA